MGILNCMTVSDMKKAIPGKDKTEDSKKEKEESKKESSEKE